MYRAFPARSAYQQAWIDYENKAFPWGVNWRVALDSLKYTNPGSLHHESNLPHFNQVQERFHLLRDLWYAPGGASMDVNETLDRLQTDLQSIVNGTYPTPTLEPTAVATAPGG